MEGVVPLLQEKAQVVIRSAARDSDKKNSAPDFSIHSSPQNEGSS
jgi:hypothetical protein